MKRCPTCNRTFTDRNLSFCLDDGTPLVPVTPAEESEGASGPTSGGARSAANTREENWKAPAYQPPGAYVPPGSSQRRRTWPWVIAILGIVFAAITGIAVVVAITMPGFLKHNAADRPSVGVRPNNRNDSNFGQNLNTNPTDNGTRSDGNSEANTNADESLNPPPIDPDKVLSDLTDLEDAWTVANVNADKKTLDRILADDYVGITDGRPQGKKQYLNDIQRDTSVEKWAFEDLKVDLKGDRATLTGIVKFTAGDNEAKYRFVDKFVWRDGRWQATASQVDPIK